MDERGAVVTCSVANDEETFRFICHLIRSDPRQYHWFRVCVSDEPFLYHIGKVIGKRYWEAETEHIAAALGSDERKPS